MVTYIVVSVVSFAVGVVATVNKDKIVAIFKKKVKEVADKVEETK